MIKPQVNTGKYNKCLQVSKNFNEFHEIDGNLLREINRNLLSVLIRVHPWLKKDL